MNEQKTNTLLLLSAIPGLLLLSGLFDYATSVLRMFNAQGAGWEPFLVLLFPLFALVLVLVTLALYRQMIKNDDIPAIIPIIMGVLGLLVVLSGPLIFFLAPMELYFLVELMMPGTYVFQTGVLLAGMGLLHWLLK